MDIEWISMYFLTYKKINFVLSHIGKGQEEPYESEVKL